MGDSLTWPVLPDPGDLERGFWKAGETGRLVVQRCDECATYQHPPRAHCWRCASDGLSFAGVSGRGEVYASCVNRQEGSTPFAVPYTSVVVELEEQPGLLLVTHHEGEKPHWAALGTAVVVVFQRVTPDVVLPQFVPAKDEAR